jgi:hypothetical protein
MFCFAAGTWDASIHRMVYGGYRRFLPANHAYRTDPRFGEPETAAAPALRTHATTVLAAAAVEAARSRGIARGSVNDPASALGVLGASALLRVPRYDLHKRTIIDLMHTGKDVIVHFIELLKGERVPKRPSEAKKSNRSDNGDHKADEKAVERQRIEADWAAEKQRHEAWTLSKAKRDAIDEKFSNLKTPSGFRSRSCLPFARTGMLCRELRFAEQRLSCVCNRSCKGTRLASLR